VIDVIVVSPKPVGAGFNGGIRSKLGRIFDLIF